MKIAFYALGVALYSSCLMIGIAIYFDEDRLASISAVVAAALSLFRDMLTDKLIK